MTIETLYWVTALIPLVLTPLVLPMVVLMARRKRLTDAPNARKLQENPVVVMGGTVIMLVLCTTFIFVNLFYDIDNFFPLMCVMLMLYIFGMLDDNIGLSWQFKLGMQVCAVLLLFFGGSYGVHSLYGLFGNEALSPLLSCLLTVLVGLLLLNAVNFIDGIDGLASAIGMLTGGVMAYWCIRHGFIGQGLISIAFSASMAAFFCYNVFSRKYKMYLGDSGSLVLGLFVYISACPDPFNTIGEDFLVDRYFVSFMIALFSAVIFDLIRVVTGRVMRGRTPFDPDRTHLHHILVDLGMRHLLATTVIVFFDAMTVLVWLLTADSGMAIGLQAVVVIVAGVAFFWLPYFYLDRLRLRHPERFARQNAFWTKVSGRIDPFFNFVTRLLDNHKTLITHERK